MMLALLAFCAVCSPDDAPGADAAAPAPGGYATQAGALARLPRPPFASRRGGRRVAAARGDGAPRPDAAAVGELWLARLGDRGALLGYGLAGKGPEGPSC